MALNRVLYSGPIFLRPIYHGARRLRGATADGSSFPFIIEEFLAVAATQIAIPQQSVAQGFVDVLPEDMRRWVEVVDETGIVSRRREVIFSPIAEELGLAMRGPSIAFRGNNPGEVENWAASLYFQLYPFLLGLEHRLQVDVDIDAMKKALELLRNRLRSQKARIVAAALTGLLSEYRSMSVPGLVRVATPNAMLVSQFEDYLEDELYQAVSEGTFQLGFPERIAEARRRLGRLTKALVRGKTWKGIWKAGNYALTASTQLPPVDLDVFPNANDRYLPPVASFRELIDRAESNWKRVGPPLIPLGLFEDVEPRPWND